MRCARSLTWMLVLTALAMQSVGAAEPDPNSGCLAQGTELTRQRPGEGLPDRLQAPECDPTRLPTPTTSPLSGSIPVNRWRIIDSLGLPDNRLDPYATNNPF